VSEELPDLGFGHFAGVAFVVEENKTSRPLDVRLLSSDAEVFEPRTNADLIQKSR
jgi:hypothetical protein